MQEPLECGGLPPPSGAEASTSATTGFRSPASPLTPKRQQAAALQVMHKYVKGLPTHYTRQHWVTNLEKCDALFERSNSANTGGVDWLARGLKRTGKHVFLQYLLFVVTQVTGQCNGNHCRRFELWPRIRRRGKKGLRGAAMLRLKARGGAKCSHEFSLCL